MSIKDITVLIDNALSAENRIQAAIALAEREQASVTGVYAYPSAQFYLFPYPYTGIPTMQQDMVGYEQELQKNVEEAKTVFESLVANKSIITNFVAVKGPTAEAFGATARFTDIGIVSQPGSDLGKDQPSFVTNRILLHTGVPILCIPKSGWTHPIGADIAIAWRNNAESAHAVNGAMPLLKQAKQVDVICCDPSRDVAQQEAVRCCARLSHHGIDAVPQAIESTDHRSGENIMQFTEKSNKDLLIMGAWGHSRLSEIVLGGATASALRLMTVPVLFAH